MNQKTKKFLILNIPYVVIGLICTNVGEAWRIAAGADIGEKILGFLSALGTAFSNPVPSIHPFDLCIGIAIGGIFRLIVYVKINAKQPRHSIYAALAERRELIMSHELTALYERLSHDDEL